MNRRRFAQGIAAFGALSLAGPQARGSAARGKVPMKITDVRPVPVGRYLFVTVHTNEGITGLGESGTWGFLEASQGAIETFKRYLVGQDPLRIEHHWQYLYRSTHFSGSAIMGALSAIDIALWDIAGKYFGVPCYQLLGGLTNGKKIAALAEAYYAQVVPHNPLSPVSTAACVQLAACIPNFALQEYPRGEHEPPKSEIVKGALKQEDGYLIIPDSPGIGVELAEDAQQRHPYRPRSVTTRLHEDGSVVDQSSTTKWRSLFTKVGNRAPIAVRNVRGLACCAS